MLFAHLWWLTLIYILAFWFYYERVIIAEEKYLRNKFGNEYLAWASVTPVIVPNLSNYRKPSLPFSLKKVLRREYNGFFAVIVVMFFVEVVGELFVEGPFDVDIGWILLLATSFIVWLTLRTLKKYTTLLNVEGR